MAYNVEALLSGFEFEKQMYMTIDEIKAKAEMLLKNSRETQGEFVQVYNNGFEDGVNFVLQNLQQCNVIVALPPMHQLFKDWCKETGRNGGVIVGQSIREFCEYADAKLKQNIGGNA